MNARPILKLSKPRATDTPAPKPASAGDLPRWWLDVEKCRRIAEHPLLGLPAGSREQPRPLVQGATQALVDVMTASGKTRSAIGKARNALRGYRLSRAYSRACATQADALELLTGAIAAPVSDVQKRDAAARLAEIKP